MTTWDKLSDSDLQDLGNCMWKEQNKTKNGRANAKVSKTLNQMWKFYFVKILIKGSDFLLANTKSFPKWQRPIFVSLLADLHTLGRKRTKKISIFLSNFHFFARNFIFLLKLLYKKKFFFEQGSSTVHVKQFFSILFIFFLIHRA